MFFPVIADPETSNICTVLQPQPLHQPQELLRRKVVLTNGDGAIPGVHSLDPVSRRLIEEEEP